MTGLPSGQSVIVCRWNAGTVQPARLARLRLRPELLGLNLSEAVVDDVLLAASELVANATEHAAGPYELRLLTSGGEYVLECHDSSPDLPPIALHPVAPPEGTGQVRPGFDLMGERGRGLSLLSSLFQGCLSARRTPSGKAVFVVFGARLSG
ncbi:hypothetical protein DN069_20415 [Streptacidiphilus pinicola]|uniref:Histidine kinase/HSP90-like ATPase domain-containing protein n=1 Tax=Streptacidiphilus pinicola TaxID=2219663 RepID=A0A2X0K3G3_9ACTN|nr:ATP-binding protein [Streptacidiphilus pinicola]RAG83805.1 hypothetical protein DN069_20415 [Streptacidiphilus pinicola]